MVGSNVVVSAGAWDSLSATGTSPNMSVTATANGTTVDTPLTTGTITPGGQSAGLLTAINSYIPSYQAALDTVASNLASTVNTQLESGYTASGTTGTANDLFTGTTAASISVAITNPAGIAAATNASAAANDGSNAQAMAELFNSPTGPDQAYRTLIQQIGSDTQTTNNQVTTQTAVATAAQQNLQAVTGVNTDQQMVSLISFQQAYQASAKVISTVDQAMQSLLAAV
jgi:flagellar hook-associated protein 1 FlgK